MAEDMVKFFKYLANILGIFVIILVLLISISIVYGSDSPVSRDAAIAIRIQSPTQINADIDEDFKWVDVFFCGERAPDKLLDQQITLSIQNTGAKYNLITAPLIATVEESTALIVRPGEKREVFRGRLGDLIDKTYECPDKSRKRGIGVSALQNPMVHAHLELVFQKPQSPGDLNTLAMRTWWFSPGEA